MQRDFEFFCGEELELVYIAKRLKDALALEKALTEEAVDYMVETDTYLGGLLFRRELAGAFFYVAPGAAETVRGVMARRGYKPYLPGA
jgi:hypothetical protein